MNGRAGFFKKQASDYSSFVPSKLPPNPPIIMDSEMLKLLSNADRKLGRLDGVTQILPNPALFVAMYVKKEALLSAQIEGTQASLIDILNIEDIDSDQKPAVEVVDYIKAMYYGLQRLNEFPMSLRLLREIHGILLENGRGSSRNPGEFRKSQNWIGPAGSTISTAIFVPPTITDMMQALNDFEVFLHEEDEMPILIKIALIHAQFETIHPFLDGNGRMGRLLITFWLCQQKILSEPLLYLSYYFKQNRLEYYDRLMAIRLQDDWEGWVKFFLKGVSLVSDEAIDSAKQILAIRENYRERLTKNISAINRHCIILLDYLFENPVLTKVHARKILDVSGPTANSVVDHLVDINVLVDYDPERQRNKRYIFSEYLVILERGTELMPSEE